jgi:hypothetical protein
MSDQSPDPAPPTEVPLARTLRLQKLVNRVVRGLLATPVLSRGIGRRLVTIYVIGRTSGRRFTIPVAYTATGDGLLVGSPFPWARNLRTGEPVDVRYLGRRRRAEVEVFTEQDDVVRLYATIARGNRNFARFNGIRVDAAGEPDSQDLHRAWVGGARVIRLRP